MIMSISNVSSSDFLEWNGEKSYREQLKSNRTKNGSRYKFTSAKATVNSLELTIKMN